MQKSNLGHEQVVLQHPQLEYLKPSIDVELAPLISACWGLGIMTQQCCWKFTERQESWIQFSTTVDAIKFLTHVIDVAQHIRIVTIKSEILKPDIWFPHFEIPVLIRSLTKKVSIPM